MLQFIKFGKPMAARGRSGMINTSGIEVQADARGDVTISPMTTRGNTSESCWIEVPVASVPALRKMLERVEVEFNLKPGPDFPVRELGPRDEAEERMTCGTCGRSWDDAVVTSMTPVPAARCPFEAYHPR